MLEKDKKLLKSICKEIKWEEAIAIRHMVLWPDKAPEFCHVTGDESARHFGIFIDAKLVGVASVYLDKESARLRKFATLKAFQGRGAGTQLLTHILDAVKKDGIRHFWCDARESSIGFYERFGMRKEGDRFYKSDISYYKMSKLVQ